MPSLSEWITRERQLGGPTAVGSGDWFAQQGAPTGGGAGDTSWWNPQDPQGSLQRLLAGRPTTSQTILELAPQLQAVGIELSPPNAEGITSKIHIPGVGWTRILDQAVRGGQGTGWVYIPQGSTGPGGSIPIGGGGGLDAAGSLAALQASPGYQFRLGEGAKALERSAAARGTLLTGGTLKGLQRYAQDYASGEYQNRYNQLSGLAGLGANAAGATANAGSQYAQTAGDLLTQQGNAQAAGTVGGANAWQNAIGQGTNLAQLYYLSRLMQPRGGGPGAPPLPGTDIYGQVY